jgi:DHA1 family bicyclomycin/chloramphenicol resistance-like MFS transporter
LFVLLGALAAIGPAAMDMYLPALPAIAADLDASTAATQTTLTTYLCGLAIGQLLAGTASDSLGRRRPVLTGVALYVVSAGVCAVATSIAVLAAGRFLQGCAAAAGMAISRAVIRDVSRDDQLAHRYSRLLLVIGVAPVIAPMIGAQVLAVASWRWMFLLLAAFGVLLFAATLARLPETLPRERRRTGGLGAVGVTYLILIRRREFLACVAALAVGMAALVSLIATTPFVVDDVFGRPATSYATLFLAGAVAMIAASQANAWLVGRVSEQALLVTGLCLVLAAGVGLVTVGDESIWTFAVCFVVVFGSWGLVPANAMALALRGQSALAGSASAMIGVTQYATGALAAPVVGLAGVSTTNLGLVIAGLAAIALTAFAFGLPRASARPGLGTR